MPQPAAAAAAGTAAATAAAAAVPAAAAVATTATASKVATPQKRSAIDDLVLAEPPPLDPVWLQHERDLNLPTPRPVQPPLLRQPLYVIECRELNARMMAPGARDHHLAEGIRVRPFTVPSSLDSFDVPVLEYSLEKEEEEEQEQDNSGSGDNIPNGHGRHVSDPDYVVLYIHGGGLHIGEADSEELSCRRILKEAELPGGNRHTNKKNSSPLVVYSVGYRLMPQNPASTCVADCVDAFRYLCAAHPAAKVLLIGSSSGGELAAFVAQDAAAHHIALQGVVLRCPVTSDAFNGDAYIPPALRPLHTSAASNKFVTTLLGRMNRLEPRDGLALMPLEAPAAVLAAQPRNWIQVCTNDMLYSDGVCYAKALETAGAEVQVDAVVGWPHTFWLKTPWMDRALEADKAMLRGLAWAASGP